MTIPKIRDASIFGSQPLLIIPVSPNSAYAITSVKWHWGRMSGCSCVTSGSRRVFTKAAEHTWRPVFHQACFMVISIFHGLAHPESIKPAVKRVFDVLPNFLFSGFVENLMAHAFVWDWWNIGVAGIFYGLHCLAEVFVACPARVILPWDE